VKNGRKEADPIDRFFDIAGLEACNVSTKKVLNSIWTIHFFPSDIKTFLFKLHHNILGLNSRVFHINPQREPTCSFCVKEKNLPAERETFQHFFWYCPTTRKMIKKF
jgi:hypothetical protein